MVENGGEWLVMVENVWERVVMVGNCWECLGMVGTMAKHETQPKRSVHLAFLAEIDIRHQERMIPCTFEIIP